MHRDVSIGNILSCDGHAKLSDLEYVKKRKDLTSHEMRTASEPPITLSGKSLIETQQGTMHFMSIEVAAQEFLFPHVEEEPTLTEDEGTVPFSHNHLHDLESLWWVAAWVVFHYHFSAEGTQSPTLQDAKKKLDEARTLFLVVPGISSRHEGFRITQSFSKACDGLLPENKKFVIDLDFLRKSLVANYTAIEKFLPKFVDPGSSNDKIYESFEQSFSR